MAFGRLSANTPMHTNPFDTWWLILPIYYKWRGGGCVAFGNNIRSSSLPLESISSRYYSNIFIDQSRSIPTGSKLKSGPDSYYQQDNKAPLYQYKKIAEWLYHVNTSVNRSSIIDNIGLILNFKINIDNLTFHFYSKDVLIEQTMLQTLQIFNRFPAWRTKILEKTMFTTLLMKSNVVRWSQIQFGN